MIASSASVATLLILQYILTNKRNQVITVFSTFSSHYELVFNFYLKGKQIQILSKLILLFFTAVLDNHMVDLCSHIVQCTLYTPCHLCCTFF